MSRHSALGFSQVKQIRPFGYVPHGADTIVLLVRRIQTRRSEALVSSAGKCFEKRLDMHLSPDLNLQCLYVRVLENMMTRNEPQISDLEPFQVL